MNYISRVTIRRKLVRIGEMDESSITVNQLTMVVGGTNVPLGIYDIVRMVLM
jgi:hypothetical protein